MPWRVAMARIVRRPLALLWLTAFGIGFVVAVSASDWVAQLAAAVVAIAAARLALRSIRD